MLVLVLCGVALFAPVAVGRNVTGMVHVPPAGIGRHVAAGRAVSAGFENWAGVAGTGVTKSMAESVIELRPLFVIVTGCVIAGAVVARDPNASEGVTVTPTPLLRVTSVNCSFSMLV